MTQEEVDLTLVRKHLEQAQEILEKLYPLRFTFQGQSTLVFAIREAMISLDYRLHDVKFKQPVAE